MHPIMNHLKYIKQILTDLKGETEKQYNNSRPQYPPFSNGQIIQTEINKETLDWNHTLHQMDLTEIYRTFHPAEYTFFLSAHGTFFRVDHMIGHKTSLCKFKKAEIIPRIFTDYNGIKLEITTRGKLENLQI